MNKQSSQKIIVAGSMAAVLAVGVVTFALQHHAPVAVAPIVSVPAPIADRPTPAPAVAVAAAAAPVAAAAESPVAAARRESAAASIAAPATPVDVTPEVAVERQPGRARSSAGSIDDTVNHGQPVAGASLATDAQEAAKSVAAPATDSWITNEVKTQIAADSIGKDANVGVTTTLGVVMLTGSLASQDAVEHVKGVAGRVKDVRSVDVSGLTVTST